MRTTHCIETEMCWQREWYYEAPEDRVRQDNRTGTDLQPGRTIRLLNYKSFLYVKKQARMLIICRTFGSAANVIDRSTNWYAK